MQKMKLMQLIFEQDLLPNPTFDAEKSPENTAENQENDEVQKEKTPTNTRGENTIYDLTQTIISQTHTDIKTKDY